MIEFKTGGLKQLMSTRLSKLEGESQKKISERCVNLNSTLYQAQLKVKGGMISTTVVTEKGEGVMSMRHNIQGPANFIKFSICRVILTVTNQYYTHTLRY